MVTAAGLLLWAAGGQLARAGVAVAGFLTGGVLASSAAAALEPGGGWVLGIGAAGALAGTLLAFLLYRLWVGLLAGLLLGAVVPGALLLWGVEPPALPDAPSGAAAVVSELDSSSGSSGVSSLFGIFDGERDTAPADETAPPAEADADGESADRGLEGALSDTVRDAALEEARELGLQASAALGDFFETASAAWKTQLDAGKAAWDQLDAGRKRTALLGAAAGFVIGLLLGLALPDITAAMQTALVGSCLLCCGALLLLQRHTGLFRSEAPQGETGDATLGAVPAGIDPQALVLVVGLVTLIGLLLQWTLARRRADA